MLIARIATAIVAAPILLALVWLGGVPLTVVAALAAGLAAWEASSLLRTGRWNREGLERPHPDPLPEGEGVRVSTPAAQPLAAPHPFSDEKEVDALSTAPRAPSPHLPLGEGGSSGWSIIAAVCAAGLVVAALAGPDVLTAALALIVLGILTLSLLLPEQGISSSSAGPSRAQLSFRAAARNLWPGTPAPRDSSLAALGMTEKSAPGMTDLTPRQSRHTAESKEPNAVGWATALAALIYTGLPLALVILMRQWAGGTGDVAGPLPTLSRGAAWVYLTLTTVWAVDTCAYAVGRLIGRRPFWPRISPKKTWEGTLAGLIAGVIVVELWAPVVRLGAGAALALGLAVAVAAVVGDLAESALKRQARVKDAGTLLPGHGGLLDRIDSLLLAAIVVFLGGILR